MNKIVKKLVSLLFEEDTEVYVEDDLEEVVFSKELNEEKEIINKEKVSILKEEVELVKKEAKEIKQEKPAKRFHSIDLKDNKEPKNHSFLKRENTHKEYEFSPVISPMFGVKEKEKETSSSIQPPVLKTRPKKTKNTTSTIISPIYGASIVEEDENIDEAILSIGENTNTVKEIVLENNEQFEEIESSFMKSIPLEELLQEEDYNKEDAMQISLFGEDTPVGQTDNDVDYTVKE